MSLHKKTPLWLSGVTGRVGNILTGLLRDEQEFYFVGGSSKEGFFSYSSSNLQLHKGDPQELLAKLQGGWVIDFSLPEAILDLLFQLQKMLNPPNILICTTGFTEDQLACLRDLAKKMTIINCYNTSFGIMTLIGLLEKVSFSLMSQGFDCEIIETHHRMKKDVPSGTALILIDSIQRSLLQNGLSPAEVYIGRKESNADKREQGSIFCHSIRGGGVFGEHSVRFISQSEEIDLSHRAFNREVFANGALNLVRRLKSEVLPKGMISYDQLIQRFVVRENLKG